MGIWSSINSGVIVCTFSYPLEIVGYNIDNNNNNDNNNIWAKVWSEVVVVVVGGGNEGEGGKGGVLVIVCDVCHKIVRHESPTISHV